MTLTIVLIATGALLLIMITLNAMQQYRAKLEADRKQRLSMHQSVIKETEDVLQAASKLPLSKELVCILHQRLLTEAELISELTQLPEAKQRQIDAEQQLTGAEQNYQPIEDNQFQIPREEKQLIGLLNLLKRLRTILRAEHSRGKVDLQSLNNELQRIDLLQLKAETESLLTRVELAFNAQQISNSREFLKRLRQKLQSPLANSDDFFAKKQEQVQEWLPRLAEQNKPAPVNVPQQEQKPDDIDMLFQPKRKW